MSQERIEAAARAEFNSIWRGASWDGPMNPTNEETREKFRASTAAGLAAADEVLFSDEAIERAAKAAYAAQFEDGDTEWEVLEKVNSSYLDHWRDQAKAVAEALRDGKAK